jgi:biopolymer transport protein TolR
MARRKKHGEDVIADINITPFTDVVLVLLIIFMIATPLIVGGGIKVEPPKAETAKPEEEKFVAVSIDAKGDVFLDGKYISIDGLYRVLQADAQQRGMMVKINGDKRIKYEVVLKVLDATRKAGVLRYLLVAEKTGSGAAGGR